MTTPSSLKSQKEAFVAGHAGTSVPEELLLLAVLPPVVGWWCFSRLCGSSAGKPSSTWQQDCWKSVAVEALCFPVPMMLCQSAWLYPWGVLYLLAMPVVVVAAAAATTVAPAALRGSAPPSKSSLSDDRESSFLVRRRAVLTVYRSCLMWMTVIAILAVDFRIFPRRFAKTEAQGYGLMDLGAASFVASAGMVSPRARAGSAAARDASTLRARWLLPAGCMGLLRLATHKSIDYQEHASEYGVHWNFFFTLVAVHVFGSVLPGPTVTLPLAMLIASQVLLEFAGLQRWIESAPRTCARANHKLCNLVVANREGLWGCVGYVGLYLLCEGLAYRYLWKSKTTHRYSMQLVAAALLAGWKALDHLRLGTVSRRTTNLWFVLWVLTVNWTVLAALDHLASSLSFATPTSAGVSQLQIRTPPVLSALNRHGLPVFVAANLLTGLVNLVTDTLGASHFRATAILLAYAASVGVAALLLDRAYGSEKPV